MSETVHYKGVATKIEQPDGYSLKEVARKILRDRGKEINDGYHSEIQQLCEENRHEFFYYEETKSLYRLDNDQHDLDDEIISAEKMSDGSIEYELKYYNGGTWFSECLEAAFNSVEMPVRNTPTCYLGDDNFFSDLKELVRNLLVDDPDYSKEDSLSNLIKDTQIKGRHIMSRIDTVLIK